MQPATALSNGRLWTLWGDRLLAALLVLLSVGLSWLWIGAFYLDQPINEILSFSAADIGLLGNEGQNRLIMGPHAFGDFQALPVWVESLAQGTYPDPPPPYLPFSFAYGLLFVNLSPWLAVMTHQVLTVGLIVTAGLLLLRSISFSRRIIVVVPTTILTIPMIATLDTGNIQGVIVGLLMIAVVLLQRNRPATAAIVIGFAIAFKGYPAVLLIWPLALGRWKFALTSASVGVGVNVVAFAILPGGLFLNLGRYIEGLGLRPGQGMIDAESSLRGLVAKAMGLVAGFDVPSIGSLSFLIIALGVLWILTVFFLLHSRRLPQWAAALLTLSTLQMAVPTSYNYSLGWASLAALWFGCGALIPSGLVGEEGHDDSSARSSYLRWIGLASISLTLAPIGYRLAINNVVVNVSTIVSPTLLLVFLTACIYVVARTAVAPRLREATQR